MQKFDVLIVGAGMVGLTLALAIRKQSRLRVGLVDSTPLQTLSEEPEVRVSAINAVSQQLFSNLDVWPLIEKQRMQPYQHMHVWQKNANGVLDFSAEDIDLPQVSTAQNQTQPLGWIIENNVIRTALWQKCQQDPEIHFLTEHTLIDISLSDSDVFVSFNNSPPVLSKMVVGADGANSWVRNKMNFDMSFRDYDHHALVATVNVSQSHHLTAWQVFLSTGPLALLPLLSTESNGDLCSIVWSTSPEEAKRLTALSAEEFSKELCAATDGKLGVVTLASERFTYPLSMRLCHQFSQDRVVLVGDAAHTIHPLAGQGVNLGLLDAAALAQTLCMPDKKQQRQHQQSTELNESTDGQFNQAHQSHQASPFEHTHILQTQLAQYSRWRKSEATEMVAAMEAIKQTFTPTHQISQTLRAIGMSIINSVKPLKQLCIKQALGYKGNLPHLAKPKKS